MKYAIVSIALIAALLLAMGCDRTITGDTQQDDENPSLGCLECHTDGSGPNRAIAAQFAYSVHASGDNTDRNRLTSAGYASCERCHTAEGFIAYATGVPASGDHFSAFDCFTCHEPHSNGDFRVRVTDAVTLENSATYNRGNSNICASCHHSRRDVGEYVVDGVSVNSHWGPHHSNQADMLIGENAYEYEDYQYSDSWHATGVVDGCPSCHMSPGAHESVGGHSWNMTNDERGFENITGCNVDGCHGANPVSSVDRETVFDFDGDGVDEGVQDELNDLLDSLGTLLEAAGMVDEDHVPVSVTVSTADSAGALYNFLFVEEDRSVGVHNTAYAVGLLKSSINFLNTGSPNGAPGHEDGTGRVAMKSHSPRTLPAH